MNIFLTIIFITYPRINSYVKTIKKKKHLLDQFSVDYYIKKNHGENIESYESTARVVFVSSLEDLRQTVL